MKHVPFYQYTLTPMPRFPTFRQPNTTKTPPPKPDRPGKFIVLYGINNLGKSTQAKLLVEMIKAHGEVAEHVKYPVYELVPSGVLLNNFLRSGNFHNLSPREAQIVYALNRSQYEPEIIKKLEAGVHVVAEDYTGTGIAWGIGNGVDEEFLTFINSHLLKEDVAILMDGARFIEAREATHQFEKNDTLIDRVRTIHQRLGNEYGWHTVHANQPIERVQRDIWRIVKPILARAKHRNSVQRALERHYPHTRHAVTVTHINPHPAEAVDVKKPASTPQLLPRLTGRLTAPISTPPPATHTATLPVRRVRPDATVPQRAHADDAGLDLFSDAYYTLYPGQRARIKTGIACAIPTGHAGLIWDKSGLAATGLKTAGGVIDAGYRGEIQIVVINLSNDIIEIDRGQKIAQMLIQEIKTPACTEVNELNETTRNEGGFGSTGA